MINQHRIDSRAGAALLGLACVLIVSACGQSASSVTAAVPNAPASPSPPPGGPVPAQLVGDWYVHLDSCPLVKLTLTATTYALMHCGTSSSGDVFVNKGEIDFFNADLCGLKLPDGVGRYSWALTGGILQFSALNQDPCPRGAAWLANRSYSRTS